MILRPTTGRISSPFGWRWGFSDWHGGVDFAAPIGTPVYAAHSGTVVNVWPNGAMDKYGRAIVIKHDQPADAPYSLYAHLSAATVAKGERVSQGQRIGSVGTTAASRSDASRTVPAHLHFELLSYWPPAKKDQYRVDPTPFLDARGTDIRPETGLGLGSIAALLGLWWWVRNRRAS